MDQVLGNLVILLVALANLALFAGVIIIANAVALAMLERRPLPPGQGAAVPIDTVRVGAALTPVMSHVLRHGDVRRQLRVWNGLVRLVAQGQLACPHVQRVVAGRVLRWPRAHLGRGLL